MKFILIANSILCYFQTNNSQVDKVPRDIIDKDEFDTSFYNSIILTHTMHGFSSWYNVVNEKFGWGCSWGIATSRCGHCYTGNSQEVKALLERVCRVENKCSDVKVTYKFDVGYIQKDLKLINYLTNEGWTLRSFHIKFPLFEDEKKMTVLVHKSSSKMKIDISDGLVGIHFPLAPYVTHEEMYSSYITVAFKSNTIKRLRCLDKIKEPCKNITYTKTNGIKASGCQILVDRNCIYGRALKDYNSKNIDFTRCLEVVEGHNEVDPVQHIKCPLPLQFINKDFKELAQKEKDLKDPFRLDNGQGAGINYITKMFGKYENYTYITNEFLNFIDKYVPLNVDVGTIRLPKQLSYLKSPKLKRIAVPT